MSKLDTFTGPGITAGAGPHSKENTITTHDAALILVATISNFSWLYTIKRSWFK